MNDITQIVEVPYLNGTPARVNHDTGVMEISQAHFKYLDPIYKSFVTEHERGHLKLNTRSEYQADEFAMNELLKRGYPLTKILESLTRVLQYNKQDHYGRTIALLNKLRSYDYYINGNKKVLTNFNLTMNTPNIYAKDVYDSAFSSFIPIAAIGVAATAAPKVLGAVNKVKSLLGFGKSKTPAGNPMTPEIMANLSKFAEAIINDPGLINRPDVAASVAKFVQWGWVTQAQVQQVLQVANAHKSEMALDAAAAKEAAEKDPTFFANPEVAAAVKLAKEKAAAKEAASNFYTQNKTAILIVLAILIIIALAYAYKKIKAKKA